MMASNKKAPTGNSRRPNMIEGCPLTAALAAIGGKWKFIIVYWLADSPKHFAALRQAIPGISQKVLTQQLRELVADDLVQRHPTGTIPAPVEYSLTEYGQTVIPLVEAMRIWGRTHIEHGVAQHKDIDGVSISKREKCTLSR